jgi:hypothetical protein
MTPEERTQLEKEWSEINEKVRNAEFIDPKWLRRRDEITSLLMTDGERKDIHFKFIKGKESKRVTSFTRNRR